MKNGGFSLIELIIVVMIVSILLTIAGLSGRTWINKYRVEQQTQEMYVDLMNTRARAMQRARVHFVVFSAGGYVVYEDTNPAPDGNGEYDPGSDTERLRKTNRTAYLMDSNAAGEISMDTRGLITGARLVWIASDLGTVTNCVTISATRILTGVWNGMDDDSADCSLL